MKQNKVLEFSSTLAFFCAGLLSCQGKLKVVSMSEGLVESPHGWTMRPLTGYSNSLIVANGFAFVVIVVIHAITANSKINKKEECTGMYLRGST